jgi:aldehyde:ferredoxin oxidoreductase
MDTITAGCVIAFAMELWERGLLTKNDTDGLDLSWGNAASIIALVHKIATRNGFGDLLAEGSWRVAKDIGHGAEESTVTVKKMEISGQDGRTHRSMALGHATAARGGDHLRSLITIDQLGYQDIAAARFGADKLPEICDPYSEIHKALATKITEDVYALRDTLLVCWYTCSWPPIFWLEDFGHALVSVTGEPSFGDSNNLIRIAERIVTLKRAFNVREGLSRSEDQLPARFFSPMPEGPGKGQVVNLDIMLDEYYVLRGWNRNGIPTREIYEQLGLSDVANSLKLSGNNE